MNAPAHPAVLSPREGYDRWAPTYDGTPNPLLALETRVLRDALPALAGLTVLDLGCGTGRWLEHCVGAGARSVGLDVSYAMLRQTKGKPGIRHRVACGEIGRLPLANSFADMVIASFSLEHCAELQSAASEIARVAKPASAVFISQMHPDASANGWRCGFQDGDASAEITTRPHHVGALTDAFGRQGFSLTRLWEPRLGDPEFPLFVAAGRQRLFESACRMPAVLICRFCRGGQS